MLKNLKRQNFITGEILDHCDRDARYESPLEDSEKEIHEEEDGQFQARRKLTRYLSKLVG